MIKRVNLKPNLVPPDDYNVLIQFLKGLAGQYVVSLKDISIQGKEKEYLIEKGSLVRIKEIVLQRATKNKELQDYYCTGIRVDSISENGEILTSILQNSNKIPKDEQDCIEALRSICKYLSDTFGITNEVEKISKKLNKYADENRGETTNFLLLLGAVILIAFIVMLFTPENIVTSPVLSAILLILGLVAGFFIFTNLLTRFELYEEIFKTLAHKHLVNKWTYYDNIITNFAQCEDTQPLMLQKQMGGKRLWQQMN